MSAECERKSVENAHLDTRYFMHALDSQTLKSLFSWSTSLRATRVSSELFLMSAGRAVDLQGDAAVFVHGQELLALLLALGEVEPLGLVREAERLEDERDGVAVRCDEASARCARSGGWKKAAACGTARERSTKEEEEGPRRGRCDSRPPT